MDDLAVIVVSTNEGRWLRPCLSTVLAQQGDCRLDVVVVDNESTDDTRAVVSEFPGARVVPSRNHGFAHANNRGLMTTTARYVLFLNPDTEIRSGTFEELIRLLDERPEVGLAGVVQMDSDGQINPTIRRFPNALRALGDALEESACQSGPDGFSNESSTSSITSARRTAIGHRGRSCSHGERLSRAPDSWTSASSSTAKSPTFASV